MEQFISANQTKELLVATGHIMFTDELGTVLTDNGRGDARVEEVGLMPLRAAQQDGDNELAPAVLKTLKSGSCGEEGSGEKENDEEKDGEEVFGILRNNAAKHIWSKYRRLMRGEKCNMDSAHSNTAEEHETANPFLAILDVFLMTVIESLETGENSGGTI